MLQFPGSAFITVFGKDFILYGKYISPIVSDTEFTHLVLKRNIYWQGEMLEYFDRIFYLAESQNFAHELKIKTLLLEAWIVLLKNFDGLSSDCKESEQSASAARLKEMITFVQQNYREKITLGEIAQSANISNSECSRCFKSSLIRHQ